MRCFHEIPALVGAIIIGGIVVSFVDSASVGSMAAVVAFFALLFLTATKFRVHGDVLVAQNPFSRTSYKLSDIERVAMTGRGGLVPGRRFHILMRPGSDITAVQYRVGLTNWPDAAPWLATVNRAVAASV